MGEVDVSTSGGTAIHSERLSPEDHFSHSEPVPPLAYARLSCRAIGAGAIVTAVVMVLFSQSVEATNDTLLADSIVHVSNVKFMATMWLVSGAMFIVGAAHIHEQNTWRLLSIACVGISFSAVVRLVEMYRLDDWAGYGVVAAALELVFPPLTIWLRQRAMSLEGDHEELRT